MPYTVNKNALDSVAAALANPNRGFIEEELKFQEWAVKPAWKKTHHRLPSNLKKAKRLYTITTMACGARFGGTRTPIICTSFKIAREFVEHNIGDLYEYSYQLAVIEAVSANRLYTMLDELYWYRWDPEEERYRAIEAPEGYENGGAVQPIG